MTISSKKEDKIKPLQVEVGDNFEDAFRKFKALYQKEKITAMVKNRMAYEKPSEKKRRKSREAVSRVYLAKLREQQIVSGEWQKRQKKKEQKRKSREGNSQ